MSVDFDEMASVTEGEDVMLFSEDEAANEVLVDGLDIVVNELAFTRTLEEPFAVVVDSCSGYVFTYAQITRSGKKYHS